MVSYSKTHLHTVMNQHLKADDLHLLFVHLSETNQNLASLDLDDFPRSKSKCILELIQYCDQHASLQTLIDVLQKLHLYVLTDQPESLLNSKPFNNLPAPDYISFVGRREELDWLKERLSSQYRTGQIVIAGIGGVGKSALAMEISHIYFQEYNEMPSEERFEAIIWVSAKEEVLTVKGPKKATLTSRTFRTLEDIYKAIAQTLNWQDISQRPLDEQDNLILKLLHSQRTLLVIDNLENVTDDRVKIFLRTLPQPTKAIITSREWVEEAAVRKLTGLPQEEAEQMIADEASEHGVTLDSGQKKRLFERTAGLPLPIKLSIARMASSETFEQMMRWLGNAKGDLPEYCIKGQIDLARQQDPNSWKLLLACSLYDHDTGVARDVLGKTADLPIADRDDGLTLLQRLSLLNRIDSSDYFWMQPVVQEYVRMQLPGTDFGESITQRWQRIVIQQSDVANGDVANGNVIMINSYGRRISRVFAGVPALPPLIVGRNRIISELKTSILAGNAVSLSASGMGGVGKTTIATAIAYDVEVLSHFSDGVLWANLGPNPDVDGILNAWSDALSNPVRDIFAREDKLAALQRTASQRSLLIILDDVWDEALALALRRIGGPHCCYLLTTRSEAIARNFAPTSNRNLSELAPDPAVDLLAALCEPAANRRDLLGELAAACGYLPLALKLIGGYLASKITFPRQVKQVIDELKQTPLWLDWASDDVRAADAGQVLALSLDALPDDAHRAAFMRLAAFAPKPAEFSLDAACTVAKSNDDTITTLLQRHLLEQLPDNPERLTLHQTLHALAAARCPDLPPSRRAHADFYLALMNADPSDWQSIEAEWEQIQHAWAWVSATPDAEDLVLPYIWAARQVMELRGYWRDEIAWIERGLRIAHAADNLKDEATLLSNLGLVYSDLGDKQQALNYYQQALPIQRQIGDRASEATTLNNIGRVYSDLNNKQQALDYFQQALPIHRQFGDRIREAITLNNIGIVYSNLNDKQQALNYYQQALPIHRQVGDRTGDATTLNNIGLIYGALGDKQQALDCFHQALPIHRQTGNRVGEANTLNNIGMVYYSLGQMQQALDYIQQAMPIFLMIGYRSGEVEALYNIGSICLAMRDLDKAQEYLEQAIVIAEQIQYTSMLQAARFMMDRVEEQRIKDKRG